MRLLQRIFILYVIRPLNCSVYRIIIRGKSRSLLHFQKDLHSITMAEKAETRTVGVNLKRIFVRLSKELSKDEIKEIKYIHDVPDSVGSDNPLKVFDYLVQRGVVTDFNPTELIETLKALKRDKLIKELFPVRCTVSNRPPLEGTCEPVPSLLIEGRCEAVSSTVESDLETEVQKCSERFSHSLFLGMANSKRATPDLVYTSECDDFRNKAKRRRVEYNDEGDIEGTIDLPRLWRMDSSSSDDSTEDEPPVASEDDKKFMEEALKAAKLSPDPHKQVGAIVVDIKTKKILGKGWNKMPKGCEDRFPWERGRITLKTKYPYVIHGVRKAVFEALYNSSKEEWDKAQLAVYATLYPDNIDAQMICEMGIKEVIYLANKYKHRDFAKASRKILENVKCRQIKLERVEEQP